MNQFNKYNFKKEILETINKLKFHETTPIQEQVIPEIIKKRDVIGISQTGTGKTHAFLLPIINEIDLSQDQVQAVITAPTRELAEQLYNQACFFVASLPGLRVELLIGGSDRQKTINRLYIQPHIVIGTPGRIKDIALDAEALKITTAKILVVDEADMTLEYGYLEDIDAVAGKMSDDLQMAVFSATIAQGLRPFLRKYMHNPKIIEIAQGKPTTDNVKHILIATKHKDRYAILIKIMQIIDPYICIIFANTRQEVTKVTKDLRAEGYRVGEINGDMEARERKQMMRRIHNNEYQYVVATDIAARGIDIDGVSHVINLDFPKIPDFYIHRSGRCGRGKYQGVCFSLYDSSNDKDIAFLQTKGINFLNKTIKNGKFVDLREKNARKNFTYQASDLEREVQKIISRPKKVKPGYKKKRKRKIDEIVRKHRRQMIRQDIQRQKKERAKQAQKEKRMQEN